MFRIRSFPLRSCPTAFLAASFVLALPWPLVGASAPPPAKAWWSTYDGPPNGPDEPAAVAVDAEGNVFVTGRSSGSGTGEDFLTLKYDPQGNELWAARYNGGRMGDDAASALAADGAGGVYVTGGSQGITGTTDYLTIKYDASGNEIWTARHSEPGETSHIPVAIAADAQGNVYVTGNRFENAGPPSYSDYTTVKYDPEGNELWTARYEGPAGEDDRAVALAVDAQSNVIVTGYSRGIDTMDDYATVKYDTDGNLLWTVRYDGPLSVTDRAAALAVDGDGNVYVTGESRHPGTDNDYTTIKYDPRGNQLWAALYDGPAHLWDYSEAIAVDGAGNVYVTGWSRGESESTDFATVKYDAQGNELWSARYDGPAGWNDFAAEVAVDQAGNVVVAGRCAGEVESYAYNDFTTVKYDAAGNELWAARYDGPGRGEDNLRGMAVDSQGNVVVTGAANAAQMDDLFRYGWQDKDFATVKYDADGKELWVALYNGIGCGDDRATQVVTDGAGNVYVTGTNGTLKMSGGGQKLWETPDGGRTLAVDDSGSVYVAGTRKGTLKLSPDGLLLWASSDEGRSLALDGFGNVYVTGTACRTGANRDVRTIKYDANGTLLWQAWYDGPDGMSDHGRALAVDGAGNVRVTGYSFGVGTGFDYLTLAYDPQGVHQWSARYDGSGQQDYGNAIAMAGGGNAVVTGVSNGDYATVMYGPAGNRLWAARYDGPVSEYDAARDIAVDEAGNVYVTGYSVGYVQSWLWEYHDFATIKYDSLGNTVWVARYGGVGSNPLSDERAEALALDDSGNVYVTGNSMTAIPFAYANWATVKYGPQGQEIWADLFDGPLPGYDAATSIALDQDDNIYVTGYTNGLFEDNDYATVKYDPSASGWTAAATVGPAGLSSPRILPSRIAGSLLILLIPLAAMVLWRRAAKASEAVPAKPRRDGL